MANKTIYIGDIPVLITKRKRQRNIRLSISSGRARVSQPTWLPFSAGEQFAVSKSAWLEEHTTNKPAYSIGQQIGLRRKLEVVEAGNLKIKSDEFKLYVYLPSSMALDDPEVQARVENSATKILRSDAEYYLPARTKTLADMYGYTYASVQIKNLKRRWGSCNSKRELVFNLHLVSLDSLYIDYVILLELTHTLYLNHSKQFWDHLESVLPNARKTAKQVRNIAEA